MCLSNLITMVMIMRTQVTNIAILIFISIFLILIIGCQKQVETRGNAPDPKLVASIKPGIHKRYHVERILGSPSTIATFDEELWYYIDSSVKTFSFFKPELLKRKVLIIIFGKNGAVKTIRHLDTTNQKEIDFVKRKTPTKGKELTFIQQAIGNLGKFRKP